MVIFLIILFTIAMLVFSVSNDIFLGYGLTISLLLFSLVGLKRNKSIKDLFSLYIAESKRSLPIIYILLLISILISTWLSCGTIPAIVYYSLKYINPNLFILFCFIITYHIIFNRYFLWHCKCYWHTSYNNSSIF